MDLGKKSWEFLRNNVSKKFTARKIASWILEAYPQECRAKLENSSSLHTEQDLLNQISAELSSQLRRKGPEVKYTSDRPRKYYYNLPMDSSKNFSSPESILSISTKKTDFSSTVHPEKHKSSSTSSLQEEDLYPLLSRFLEKLKIYSKRIDEKRSRNTGKRGTNDWLYPDIVGVENISANWSREVKDCVREYCDKKTKLWSFEVKCLLNRSTIRKSFFQTVSNSSWANWGYLVASQIENAEDTLKELRILSSLHGIGFIQLNVDDCQNSEIVIPAKEHTNIDWDTVNRLTEENKDFLNYIQLIREFYRVDKFRKSDWN